MIQTGNLKHIAYEGILDRIRSGAFEPGKVYSERQTSAELGVSRTPFHSALLQLEQDGYVDVLPSRGFMLHQLTEKDVRQTFQMRGAVEFYCASRIMADLADGLAEAVGLMDEIDGVLARQREILDGSRDIDAYEECDFSFHQKLVSYVENAEFDRLFRSYMFWIVQLAKDSLKHDERMAEALAEHEAIVDAIRAGGVAGLYAACERHFTVPQVLNLEDLGR